MVEDSSQQPHRPMAGPGGHAAAEHVSTENGDGTNAMEEQTNFLDRHRRRPGVTELASGLQYRKQRSGPADAPSPGPSTPCLVHYRGLLTDGTEFDSTRRMQPVVLSPSDVIPGWREALQLMHEGDCWEIVLPASLGYGERGAGAIPGGATLVFEIELVQVAVKVENNGVSTQVLLIGVLVALGVLLIGYQHFTRHSPMKRGPVLRMAEISHSFNPRVYFDLEVAGRPAGRVEIELFAHIVPKTAENFRALATGEGGIGKKYGKRLHFKGSSFHRIIPGFMCQAGDVSSGDGRGGESIYGGTFEDEWEHGILHHEGPGVLSMANRGRDDNGSQFFVTLQATPWLDGKHVVFGRVIKGMEAIKAAEAVGSKSGTPTASVVIADSGELGEDGEPLPALTVHAAEL
eukprot:CAMPEP_0172808592 /NCGR_PEP_ID=MMETSP1075-20121228/7785_1 /TAXON_ID=2916 /ORGANISM="Ceratium fusus, Strain PA161109" /LENGTH=402 /DNA_ID=CAMNT_0013647763 /DNA_START=18 /DNA_END=1226 /DNA_ORIENTATION=+